MTRLLRTIALFALFPCAEALAIELLCDGTGAYGAGNQPYSFKVTIDHEASTVEYNEVTSMLGKYIAKPWTLEITETMYTLTLVQHVDHSTSALVVGWDPSGGGISHKIIISRVTGKFNLTSGVRAIVDGKLIKSNIGATGEGECTKATETKF